MGKRIDRIGEKRIMNNGLLAEIVGYRGSNDIDVKFIDDSLSLIDDDCLINRGVTYHNFRLGKVGCPSINSLRDRFVKHREERTGEGRYMKNGLLAEIIRYDGSLDCTVRFENGEIREGIKYNNFKEGRVACNGAKASKVRKDLRDQRLGMVRKMNCGYLGKIVEYNNSRDISVNFSSTGYTAEHVRYDNFISGAVAPSTKRRRGIYGE